jgi:DNA-binding transcriptional MerR regulator
MPGSLARHEEGEHGADDQRAFARASRLTPKALRLYDELGLLPPAHVDPVSGCRFYAPAQLEQARLVAWLRFPGVVPTDVIAGVLSAAGDPDQAAGDLIALANEGGSPDNVTCIVANVVALDEQARNQSGRGLQPAGLG